MKKKLNLGLSVLAVAVMDASKGDRQAANFLRNDSPLLRLWCTLAEFDINKIMRTKIKKGSVRLRRRGRARRPRTITLTKEAQWLLKTLNDAGATDA